ncbi:rhodanese-related sulfurtransferase [Panacagrimonas perspica]|uniref:Rhodanese-related sulfurtransferase n=1 Tax=Panacagrimonas perspica TaxID=381431 RepID=A0A4V3F4T6_9GAMM|nr:rhodanese-like domain-containing protein [Panacagrimonas perspica]TDU26506.1 rhodanese-related sulfurtransferase [Panacagrimonas perspica]THD02117.1 sulfurtransferase [Panacagrimonas perspica]
MSYTQKFQALADAARGRVEGVGPEQVDALMESGTVLLDIRDREEHEGGHIAGSANLSRGKLEMNIESLVPDLDTPILCYCNVNNRGALSADSLRALGCTNARYIVGGLKASNALR